MRLDFVLDEHLRGALMHAIHQHNAAGHDVIDAVCVGDPPDLPLGSQDPDILLWAERNDRLVLSRDKNTMIGHFAQHLHLGHHSPGLLILNKGYSLPVIVAALALIAHAGDPADHFDQVQFVP